MVSTKIVVSINKMQDVKRQSLLDYLKRQLSKTNRKVYIHRLVYVIRHLATDRAGNENWVKILESKLKKPIEDKFEEPLSGLGLFYKGYVVNIIEGSETLINTHLVQVTKLISEKYPNAKLKVLMMMPHVLKRYFPFWRACQVTPPVLLQPIPPSNEPQQYTAKLKECLTKLYHLCERLEPAVNDDRALSSSSSFDLDPALQNCKTLLPETALLDFLLDSPLLLTGHEFVEKISEIPVYTLYHYVTWPPPPDYVPKNIV